jgi:hypothetical protein
MGIAGTIFYYIGVSMGWLYTFMGVLLGSAVVPIGRQPSFGFADIRTDHSYQRCPSPGRRHLSGAALLALFLDLSAASLHGSSPLVPSTETRSTLPYVLSVTEILTESDLCGSLPVEIMYAYRNSRYFHVNFSFRKCWRAILLLLVLVGSSLLYGPTS